MNHLQELTRELDGMLAGPDAELARRFPGERGVRQPVHTVYVPADQYTEETVTEWQAAARAALERHAGSAAELSEALELGDGLDTEVYERVSAKLGSEPIEDLRIDFEDGYGAPGDEQEDGVARGAAATLASAVREGTAPPFHGIRFKSFEAPTRARGLRTLDLFVGELARLGAVTGGFVVTLPKVTSVAQVEAMTVACRRLEEAHSLPPGTLCFEIQIETPQSVLGPDGTALVARMVHAAAGRCTGLHYGTYDYSAACGIAAEYQSMEHPAADHAKAVMQVAVAGTGVFLSDGSTNVVPVGDTEAVRSAWRRHARLVRRSLERGFYQGWDMHPAHLPSRYAATYAFYRESLAPAGKRLRAYVSGEAGEYLDEPATAAALAGFVLRGVECGAVNESEVDDLIGVDGGRLAELVGR